MEIVCDQCGYVIDKDKYINGKIVEEYKNIFGTYCPCCYNLIKSYTQPFYNEKQKMKIEILREEMREKLKKNIKGEI